MKRSGLATTSFSFLILPIAKKTTLPQSALVAILTHAITPSLSRPPRIPQAPSNTTPCTASNLLKPTSYLHVAALDKMGNFFIA